jgi:hypothetical protein
MLNRRPAVTTIRGISGSLPSSPKSRWVFTEQLTLHGEVRNTGGKFSIFRQMQYRRGGKQVMFFVWFAIIGAVGYRPLVMARKH